MFLFVAVILLFVWIYLVWKVRKERISLFNEQMEPESAERRYKMLKAFLLVGGISFAVFIVSVILHNVLYALLDEEEPVSFFIALISVVPFFIGTVGGLVVFLRRR